ncbi:FAD-dependent oxidoreductase [Paracoccus sp. DK608]|uniref:FAD-dependent oxidoreductase n=2 Tax=Paracoccus shanxieyensis TaxID=2675752 RepID=A0A6L6IUY9_9RHOB|nr:FAD-dependent oxidoreductase [Paracoccus shanxieyensis]MTH87681.1 FAD-dependent oxidoreductase [Paracoccus shanxieyensis]
MATRDCDLLVLGSGAAGLSAALTAARHGLRVILAEKDSVLGGTSAWSGGWIWAPRNPVVQRSGVDEPPEGPRAYLQAVLGNNFDPGKVDAFLDHAPRTIAFLEAEGLEFQGGLHIPDTYSTQPGAGMGGRSVIAAPFDGLALGEDIRLLRKPLPETSFMGMTIQSGPDLRAFMTMTRSVPAFVHVTRRFTRHLWDLLRHGRGMQLRNGNALVARLMLAARKAGVEFITEAPATRLLQSDGQVRGAVLATARGDIAVQATKGVVLATGGWPQDIARRAAQFPAPDLHATLAVPQATGDGLRLAEAVGAVQDRSLASPGAWCPVSEVRWPDGRVGAFPHIIERGKPGIIGVLRDGRRFCNEGLGYHDYVAALLNSVPPGQPPESWLICTRAFQRRYGLGISRPAPVPVGGWIRRGYIQTGDTPEALARACGIDPQGLARTLADWNRDAVRGEDPAFGRGTTAYMRLQGDPDQHPNPCVAPIEKGPFYAVKVIPGSFGTFAGLATDGRARVLDGQGQPIAGLHAAGCDMASVMGGHYPAGGINLGPALTFGHIAALDAAGLL